MHFDHDVIVAGAGPAGVATAVSLARAAPALRVLVIDRARFPRPKPCGGGLTGHIVEAMEALGLSLTVPSFPSERAIVRYGRFSREVALARPVRTVRREEFDRSLVEQARALGVEIREGVGLAGFTVEDGGVTIRAGKGSEALRARVLVGADGAGSLVRKALDETGEGRAIARDKGRRPAEAERDRPIRLFRAEIPDRGWHRPEMLYDFTPMLDGVRGYLWIFPVPGGLLNVGLMHDPSIPKSGGELSGLLRERLAAYGVALDEGALRGWPAWGYLPGRRIAAPHVLTVGDAAGIDALTGEGIAVALEQGLVCGREIARAFAANDFRFAGYRRAVRRATVGRELALDRRLARMLYGARDHRTWLSLVLHDEAMLSLYAARVSGSLVLADRKHVLLGALVRHLGLGRERLRALREAERDQSAAG